MSSQYLLNVYGIFVIVLGTRDTVMNKKNCLYILVEEKEKISLGKELHILETGNWGQKMLK